MNNKVLFNHRQRKALIGLLFLFALFVLWKITGKEIAKKHFTRDYPYSDTVKFDSICRVLSTIKEQKQIDEGNTPESKKEYNYFDHFKEEKQGKAFEDIVTEKIKHGGRNENNFRHPSYNKIIVELNEAQSVDLIKLAGIGEVYSDRIIKYRDLLGGFYSVRQLTEVYGLDSSIIEKNQGNIALEKSEIEQLDINQVGFAELIRHPYLQKYNVNAILSYRRYKKNIKSINELKENGILPDSVFNKMAPYLSCE